MCAQKSPTIRTYEAVTTVPRAQLVHPDCFELEAVLVRLIQRYKTSRAEKTEPKMN